jgi:hypothetical protein
MEKQAKKLMDKFANAKILDEKKYEFRVYIVQKDKDGKFSNLRLGITRPSPFNGDYYYVAEVDVHLNDKGSVMRYNHLFAFEPSALEAEIEKLDNEKKWAALILPERIANALNECYHEVAPYLKEYNEKFDDIPGIASVIYKYRGSIGVKFRI